MDPSDLLIEVRDIALTRVGTIPTDDLTLDASSALNGAGQWTITLPNDHAMTQPLSQPGAGIIINGPGGVIDSGRVVAISESVTSEDPTGSTVFTGVFDSIALADALAYPVPSTSDLTQQGTGQDSRSGAAESVIHGFVSANIGPNAPANRRLPALTMGADHGFGSTVTKAARFDNLAELVAGIAAPNNLGFRIIQRDTGLVFETWQVVDRTDSVFFSVENGALSGKTSTISAPTVTRALVGGAGWASAGKFVEATTSNSTAAESAWGRRIERFVDNSSTNITSELAQAGAQALADGGATLSTVDAVTSEELSAVYGIDFNLGDRVSIDGTAGRQTAIVTGLVIKADGDGVRMGVSFGDAPATAVVGGGADPSSYLSSSTSSTVDDLNTSTIPSIEADLAAARSDLDTLNNTTLPTLQNDLTSAQGEIDTLEGTTIPALQNDLTNAKGDLATAQSNIQSLQGQFPITTTNITDGAITTPKMTANSINGDRITANTLNASKIVAGSITTDRMTANSINGDRIVGNTLDASKIVAGSITTDRMTANSINGDRIATNTLNADRIVANTITGDKIVSKAITSDKIAANAITAGLIAADAINGKTIDGATMTGGTFSTQGGSVVMSDPAINFHTYSLATGDVNAGSVRADRDGTYNPRSVAAVELSAFGGYDLVLRTTGGGKLVADVINNTTTGTAANVVVGASGVLQTTGSVRAIKLAIDTLEADDVRGLLDLPLSTWFDKNNSEQYAKLVDEHGVDIPEPALANIEQLRRIPGAIAEDVADVPGGELFVTRKGDGELSGVMYDRIGVAWIPLVRELTDKVAALEARLTQLEQAGEAA